MNDMSTVRIPSLFIFLLFIFLLCRALLLPCSGECQLPNNLSSADPVSPTDLSQEDDQKPALPIRVALSEETSAIFTSTAPGVVQVRVIENASSTKVSLGSGFFVSENGLVVSNFHVISQIVVFPARYRLEVVTAAGDVLPATWKTYDIVHDLSIISVKDRPSQFFGPSKIIPSKSISKGDRIFSMGNPLDLGMTIVEGNFNGLLEHTLYDRVHFTGSLNPGMSGGPAFTRKGQLIGVNVSGMGNQISFLVPSEFVLPLIQEATISPYPTSSEQPLTRGTKQLHENQKRILDALTKVPFDTFSLGHYQLPTVREGFLKCWSNVEDENSNQYRTVQHSCSNQDQIFVTEDFFTGTAQFSHYFLDGKDMNQFKFYDFVNSYVNRFYSDLRAGEDDVTKFDCQSRFVTTGTVPLRVQACTRQHKRFKGLIDLYLLAVSLNDTNTSVITELQLGGFEKDAALSIVSHYLGSLSWK